MSVLLDSLAGLENQPCSAARSSAFTQAQNTRGVVGGHAGGVRLWGVCLTLGCLSGSGVSVRLWGVCPALGCPSPAHGAGTSTAALGTGPISTGMQPRREHIKQKYIVNTSDKCILDFRVQSVPSHCVTRDDIMPDRGIFSGDFIS